MIYIVTQPGWGLKTPREYETEAHSIREALLASDPSLEIQLSTHIEDVRNLNACSDTVIFLSRGALKIAEELITNHPDLKVFVLTGCYPAGRVVIVSTSWLMDKGGIHRHFVKTAFGPPVWDEP